MKITYLYQSGFIIVNERDAIVIDYYKDPKSYIDKIFTNNYKNLYVLCSHSHYDHFNTVIFDWKKRKNINVIYLFSKDIPTSGSIRENETIILDKNDIYLDEKITVKAFGSTDIGISFLINFADKTIFHAGDLNNWHWNEESTLEEINEAEKQFIQEIKEIAKDTQDIDIVMFPVDPRLGKDYTKGPKQFLDNFKVKHFIPMHFENNYVKANAFKSYVKKKGCRFFLIKESGDSIYI